MDCGFCGGKTDANLLSSQEKILLSSTRTGMTGTQWHLNLTHKKKQPWSVQQLQRSRLHQFGKTNTTTSTCSNLSPLKRTSKCHNWARLRNSTLGIVIIHLTITLFTPLSISVVTCDYTPDTRNHFWLVCVTVQHETLLQDSQITARGAALHGG